MVSDRNCWWYNVNAISDASIPVESCKIAWRSIKDSKRYYSRKAKSNAELDYSSDDSFAKHSQFMDEMKFLDQTPSYVALFLKEHHFSYY